MMHTTGCLSAVIPVTAMVPPAPCSESSEVQVLLVDGLLGPWRPRRQGIPHLIDERNEQECSSDKIAHIACDALLKAPHTSVYSWGSPLPCSLSFKL